MPLRAVTNTARGPQDQSNSALDSFGDCAGVMQCQVTEIVLGLGGHGTMGMLSASVRGGWVLKH